jgi:hypothetical protein
MITSIILIIAGLGGLVGINPPGINPMGHLADQTTDRPIVHEDEGGGLSFEEDKPRIDLFAEGMKKDKSAKAYIIAYGGLVSYKNEAAIRLRCIRNYLIKAHHISPSRLKLIDGGYSVEVSVRLYLVNADDPKPTPYSFVNREAVQMRKAPKYPCGKAVR